MKTLLRIGAVAAALVGTACVHQTEQPPLSGPSSFARTLSITATPDRISQDGASQSSVTVQAIGPDGRPLSGVAVRLDMVVSGQVVDYGTLSARTIVTGSDGTARAIYTAPSAPPPPANQTVNTVTIRAIPIGNDAQTSSLVVADIRLMPVGVILPPAGTPTAAFTFTPTPVNFNIPVTFDASTSNPGTNATSIISYQWTFGDGGTASGRTATHTYVGSTSPQTAFNVTLTVTNDRGLSASTTQQISVTASPAPAGDWVNSPVNPAVGDTVIFNADGVKPAAGHTIVQYSWNFGDGATGSGFLVTHVYTVANTYAVVLSVLDDAGQKTVIPHNVTVSSGNPTVVITMSPSSGVTTATNIVFDSSATTTFGGATIVSYNWTFGDGTSSTTGPTTTKKYSAAGSYTVRLTVTDSQGRTGTATLAVTVS